MKRHWIRLGFSSFVLLISLSGWASADEGEGALSGPPASAIVSDGGSCENGDCCCSAPQIWCAGVEGTFLKVTRRDPPGVNILSVPNPDGENGDPATSELSSQYGVGPRVWLGVDLSDCWGVRARFWSFKDNADGVFGDPGAAVGAGSGNFAVGSYDLDIYTIDVEATRTWGSGPWCFEASLGARYAQMHQQALMAFYENDDGTTAFGSSSRRIGGAGLTAALEGHRSLGCSGWNVFANARGSVLWGTTNGFVTAAADDWFGEDSFGSDVERVSDPTTLCIFETQLGLEWTHPVKCMCGTLFVRLAGEYQRWSASNVQTAAATVDVSDGVNTLVVSTTPSPTIGLLGLDVAAGFRF